MPSTRNQELINPAPTGRTRKLASAVILILLLYQVIVPLEYYYRWNFGTDETDERFSWRFFSTVSLRQCNASFSERFVEDLEQEDQSIPLQSILELGSIKNFLRSNQREIIESFLRWRCDQQGVAEVFCSLSCTAPDGSPIAPVRLMIDRRTRTIRTFEPPP